MSNIGWNKLKNIHPKDQAVVEVRTNSKDRHPRGAVWGEGLNRFFDTDDLATEIEGEEWRPVYAVTPCTNRPAQILWDIDDLPDHLEKVEEDSNEYYTTFWGHSKYNGPEFFVYKHPESEVRSRW